MSFTPKQPKFAPGSKVSSKPPAKAPSSPEKMKAMATALRKPKVLPDTDADGV